MVTTRRPAMLSSPAAAISCLSPSLPWIPLLVLSTLLLMSPGDADGGATTTARREPPRFKRQLQELPGEWKSQGPANEVCCHHNHPHQHQHQHHYHYYYFYYYYFYYCYYYYFYYNYSCCSPPPPPFSPRHSHSVSSSSYVNAMWIELRWWPGLSLTLIIPSIDNTSHQHKLENWHNVLKGIKSCRRLGHGLGEWGSVRWE